MVIILSLFVGLRAKDEADDESRLPAGMILFKNLKKMMT